MKEKNHSKKISIFASWKLLKTLIVPSVIFLLFSFIFIIAPEPSYKDGFRNLGELDKYAKSIDEYIRMNGNNPGNPNYDSYYQKNLSKTFLKTIKNKLFWLLYKIGLLDPPYFSANFFKNIITDIRKTREQRGWIGNFIQKIELNQHSKIVIFGAIQGAFHSLVRDLKELRLMNIIDENLKITHTDTFCVFLGNVPSRSPYTLETLSIILRLLKNNPENVFYLKGPSEIFDVWKNHTLHKELELRFSNLLSAKPSMEEEVRSFLDTLPLSLYCSAPFLNKQKLPLFKLSPFIEDQKLIRLLNEQLYSKFLAENNNIKIETLMLKNTLSETNAEDQNIELKAVVMDIKKREDYEEMDGLRLLPMLYKGATTWTVLSCPTESYRMAFKFFYDAFVIVQPEQRLDDWKIILYNRDIRENNKNFKKQSFNFLSGKKIS